MTKVRKQVPALAALVDFWWQGVWQDVEPFGLSPRWRQWVQEGLLPLVYWEHQVAHTRCARRKTKMRQALEAVRTAFDTHAITPQGSTAQASRSGRRGRACGPRPFSAPRQPSKGATACLSQLHHNQRGCPSSATRCGRSCITSIVALRMVQRLPHGFSTIVSGPL